MLVRTKDDLNYEKETMSNAIGLLKFADRLMVFKHLYKKESKQFHIEEAEKMRKQMTVPSYLRHVLLRLHREREIVAKFLDTKWLSELWEIIELVMIREHQDFLIENGVRQCFQTKDHEAARVLWQHMKVYTKGIDKFRQEMRAYVNEVVTDLLNHVNELCLKIVDALIDLHIMFTRIISEHFDNDSRLNHCVHDAFSAVIQKHDVILAELLGNYMNERSLSISHISDNDDAVEAAGKAVDELIYIFQYIHERNIFEVIYRRGLINRVTSDRFNARTEQLIVDRLKEECGAIFSHLLEKLLKDVLNSKSLNEKFQSTAVDPDGILSVYVIPSNTIEKVQTKRFKAPAEIERLLEKFEKLYEEETKSRKFSIAPSDGLCTLQINRAEGYEPIVLSMSLSMATVLHMFNHSQNWQFDELNEQISMDEHELMECLVSLLTSRLLRSDDTDQIVECVKTNDDSDDQLRSIMKRASFDCCSEQEMVADLLEIAGSDVVIHIDQLPINTDKKSERVVEGVSRYLDEGSVIDAAVVRLLKSERKMHIRTIACDVSKMIGIEIEIETLKERLDQLCQLNIVEPSSECVEVYLYIV